MDGWAGGNAHMCGHTQEHGRSAWLFIAKEGRTQEAEGGWVDRSININQKDDCIYLSMDVYLSLS